MTSWEFFACHCAGDSGRGVFAVAVVCLFLVSWLVVFFVRLVLGLVSWCRFIFGFEFFSLWENNRWLQ